MKNNAITDVDVSVDDLNAFTEYVNDNPSTHLITGIDAGIPKRIISVNVSGDPLIMVNPVIVNKSETRVVYIEKSDTNKLKKTVRHTQVTVMTDNMHEVEFAAEKTTDFNNQSMFADTALYECVLVQRGIDKLDGIDVSHPSVRYSSEVRMPTKESRNDRTMLKNTDGQFRYVKNKKLKSYTEAGWVVV
jgi:hypothetical protein